MMLSGYDMQEHLLDSYAFTLFDQTGYDDITAMTVPEPDAAILLMGGGMVVRRRQRRAFQGR